MKTGGVRNISAPKPALAQTQQSTGSDRRHRERPTESIAKAFAQVGAILHNAAKYGIETQNRDGHPNFAAYLRGEMECACMVDPENVQKWRNALASAICSS